MKKASPAILADAGARAMLEARQFGSSRELLQKAAALQRLVRRIGTFPSGLRRSIPMERTRD